MRTDRMQAAYLNRLGGAEEIQVGELPVPVAGPGEVLIRVEAVAVNHVDRFVRDGSYPTATPFPFIIGRDVVGVVEATGRDVTDLMIGERVWSNSLGHGGRQGPTAQFAVAPRNRVYALPDGVDPVRAVAVLHPLATAYLALHVHAVVREGECVFIGGGAGHIGSALVALTKRAGARVIASVRTDDVGRCRAQGADEVLDFTADVALSGMRGPGGLAQRGLDIAIDTSGRVDSAALLRNLALRGRLILLAGMHEGLSVSHGEVYTSDRSIRGFAISNASAGELGRAAEMITMLLGEGAAPSPQIFELPLARASEAHEMLANGEAGRKRIVLLP